MTFLLRLASKNLVVTKPTFFLGRESCKGCGAGSLDTFSGSYQIGDGPLPPRLISLIIAVLKGLDAGYCAHSRQHLRMSS